LKKFLISSTGKKTLVAFNYQNNMNNHFSSITIVGDWFYAQSHAGKIGKGYDQTIFTRHAPSIQHHIDQFDLEFQTLLEKNGWDEHNCRDLALKEINNIIAGIKVL
jgi:hypothetical protein